VRSECYVAIDFDGTCVTNAYPDIGDDVGAAPWLRAAAALGAKLILHTMRHDPVREKPGVEFDAVAWFAANHIELWRVNENTDQQEWSKSPKIYAHIYIDDAALGAPLRVKGPRERPFVDWSVAGPLLLGRVAGILNQ
jgi:hypothetical protein